MSFPLFLCLMIPPFYKVYKVFYKAPRLLPMIFVKSRFCFWMSQPREWQDLGPLGQEWDYFNDA